MRERLDKDAHIAELEELVHLMKRQTRLMKRKVRLLKKAVEQAETIIDLQQGLLDEKAFPQPSLN